jgi:hypothetical protein
MTVATTAVTPVLGSQRNTRSTSAEVSCGEEKSTPSAPFSCISTKPDESKRGVSEEVSAGEMRATTPPLSSTSTG